MNTSTFDEINRIAETLEFKDRFTVIFSEYIEIFKNNILYMKQNVEDMPPEQQIQKVVHLMDFIEKITTDDNYIFEDNDDPTRRKLLQIYFLIKTKLF